MLEVDTERGGWSEASGYCNRERAPLKVEDGLRESYYDLTI
jgi:hypothetical protein